MFAPILTRLMTRVIMETTAYSTLPPLLPNQMPKHDAIAIISPVMKYGDVR